MAPAAHDRPVAGRSLGLGTFPKKILDWFSGAVGYLGRAAGDTMWIGVGAWVFWGCAPSVPYQDVRVTQATLQDANTNSVAVVGGYVGGDALLVFSGPDASGALPVALRGGRAGLALDLNIDLNPGSDVPLDLRETDGTVWLSEILGRYRGFGWAISAGLGAGGRSLKNRAGVRLQDEHFSLGGGAFVGMEWMSIHIGGHEDEFDEGGFYWVSADTGSAEDTAALWDSSPLDSGGVAPLEVNVSQGCGGESRRDTAPATDTGDTGVPPATAAGCGGGKGSSGGDDTAQDEASSGGCGSRSSDDTADEGDEGDSGGCASDDGGDSGNGGDSTMFYGVFLGTLVILRRRPGRRGAC